jgi:phosphomannomutase
MAATVVASSVVSSQMLAAIARDHGAHHVETLTGFKWLSRADVDLPACTLAYAYEEAIGHCVDPAAVRDKDGISATVLICDLAVALRHRGSSMLEALDDLARRHGVHLTAAVSQPVTAAHEAESMMGRLREAPPETLAGSDVTVMDLQRAPYPLRTDAVVLSGGDGETTFRVIVRPSGTEPKVKSYIEVRCSDAGDLADARERAATLLAGLETALRW